MTAESPRHSTRAILAASLLALRRNPTLMWFPVLSALGALGVLIVAGLVSGITGEFATEVARRETMLGGFVAYFGIHLVTVACGVALARATFDALANRPWTIAGIARELRPRLPAVATFAMLDAGVGRLLRPSGKAASRVARISGALLRGSWWAATYLVFPILAREQRTGVASIGRSAALFRQTWKEAFIGRLTLGWLWLPFLLVVLLPLGICAALGIDDARILAVAIGVPVALGGAAALFLRTLDTVYRTALYVFATEGVIPEPFDHPDLHEIFCAR